MEVKLIITRIATLAIWICIGIIGAVLYGIVNDQITAAISPEYYSVFKLDQFSRQLQSVGLLGAPTQLQAVVIGALATWWYGLFLGIMLGFCSMFGRYAPLSTRRFVRAVGVVIAATFLTSIVFGAAAYIAAFFIKPDADRWPFLTGIENVRPAFAVGWWHNGAYLGALISTVVVSYWVQIQRRILHFKA